MQDNEQKAECCLSNKIKSKIKKAGKCLPTLARVLVSFLIKAGAALSLFVFIFEFLTFYDNFQNEKLLEAQGQILLGNYEKGAKIYNSIFLRDDPVAQSNLGYLYQNGYGVNQSIEKARELYYSAALKGCKQAKYNYIRLLLLCQQEEDREQLISLFQASYTSKDYPVMQCVAYCIDANSPNGSGEITPIEDIMAGKRDHLFQHLDKFFPNFPCEKLQHWETTNVIVSEKPLSTYTSTFAKRRSVDSSSSLGKTLYTYYEYHLEDIYAPILGSPFISDLM